MIEATKERRVDKAARLLWKPKHPQAMNHPTLFADEKSLCLHQKVNRKWSQDLLGCLRCTSCNINKVPSHCEGPRCHRKWGRCHGTILFWRGPEDEWWCIHSYDGQSRRAWNEEHCWRPPLSLPTVAYRWWQCQQDAGVVGGEREGVLTENIWNHSSKNWNHCDYFLWDICERKINKHSHNTRAALKARVTEVMVGLDKTTKTNAYRPLQSGLERILDA